MKLMVRVLPGVELTWAIFSPSSALIKLDLPTLERPRKAISGASGGGKCSGAAADLRNWAWSFMGEPFHHGGTENTEGLSAKQASASLIQYETPKNLSS